MNIARSLALRACARIAATRLPAGTSGWRLRVRTVRTEAITSGR